MDDYHFLELILNYLKQKGILSDLEKDMLSTIDKFTEDICNSVLGFCNIQEVRRFPCLGNGSMDCRYAGSYDSFEWR